jgi:Tfp pilus assembly protein FimT
LELVVSIALILIMSAVAIPAIMSTLRFYQLNDKATQLAGMVKFTRFEAIRRNKAVTCQILQTGTNWTIWVDSNNNGTPDPTEAQMILTGNTNLLPSAPSPAPINAVVGPNLTAISGANASITFDPRGAVNFGAAATTVYALYIGAAGDPTSGFRAVIVMPSGSTQVWAASASGDWHRVG